MKKQLIINIIYVIMTFWLFQQDILTYYFFWPFLFIFACSIIEIIFALKGKKIKNKLFDKVPTLGICLYFLLLIINFIFLVIKEGQYHLILLSIPFLALIFFLINENVLTKPIKFKKFKFKKTSSYVFGFLFLAVIVAIIMFTIYLKKL